MSQENTSENKNVFNDIVLNLFKDEISTYDDVFFPNRQLFLKQVFQHILQLKLQV